MDVAPSKFEHNPGGRLRLLDPSELDTAQRHLSTRLTATRGARAREADYRIALDDGRLVGPFNALPQAPEIGGRQLDWAEALAASGLDAVCREVAILSVAGLWQAEYVLYAHRQAARSAGIGEHAIDDLVHARIATSLEQDAQLVQRVALALVRDHDVPDDLYRDFLGVVGETGAVHLLSLIGQYLATCTVTTCFRVPAPP